MGLYRAWFHSKIARAKRHVNSPEVASRSIADKVCIVCSWDEPDRAH